MHLTTTTMTGMKHTTQALSNACDGQPIRWQIRRARRARKALEGHPPTREPTRLRGDEATNDLQPAFNLPGTEGDRRQPSRPRKASAHTNGHGATLEATGRRAAEFEL
ncbi:unnamed protein product [Prorocentrum cordatum]|uniref:Uncharacterized protein n=1 Tax=Prorocentrum cordatum TaxID=2364126 RepID=A0ABN9Q2A5_9DINO|nr:unnamed protein product [Polarella glacialis]